MNIPRITLALTALLGLSACRSQEPWTFGLSRAVYDSSPSFDECDDPGDATIVAAVLVLPLVLDVVFLPVALPRDLIVHGPPW